MAVDLGCVDYDKVILCTDEELRAEFISRDVVFSPKTDSWLMILLAAFLGADFINKYWTTVGKTIYFPSYVLDPWEYPDVIRHEYVHLLQLDSTLGFRLPSTVWAFLYIFFPIPFLFSYFRWKSEREAYLVSLLLLKRSGASMNLIVLKAECVVQLLWSSYGYCWPQFLMREWFAQALDMSQGVRDETRS